MVGAFAASLEVGFSSVSAVVGGVWAVVPTLLGFYAVAGLIEGAVTAALLTSILRFSPAVLVGFNLLKVNIGAKQ